MTTFPLLPNSALATAGASQKSWIWQGFIARGETTLLTSLWKSGKSTLISILLAKMKEGGTLAGLPVAKGRAVILTEESTTKWLERSEHLGFGDHLYWFCRPFRGKPTYDDWHAIIAQIVSLHEAFPIDLVIIDPLSNLSPLKSENEAGEMMRTMLPLQQLTERDIGVLTAHHPRKGPLVPGQAARGSGALPGFVDIIIEMQRTSVRHAKDRRRLLHAYSRDDATPSNTVIELSPDGTDYLMLSPTGDMDFERAWTIIEAMMQRAEPFQRLSRRDIRRQWPEGFAPPAKSTLRDWINEALRLQRLDCEGSGTRGDPTRYCLKGIVEKWKEEWPAYMYHAFGFDVPLPPLPEPSQEEKERLERQYEAKCRIAREVQANIEAEEARRAPPPLPVPSPQPLSMVGEYFESQVRGAQGYIATLAKMDAERIAAEKARTAAPTPPATEPPTT